MVGSAVVEWWLGLFAVRLLLCCLVGLLRGVVCCGLDRSLSLGKKRLLYSQNLRRREVREPGRDRRSSQPHSTEPEELELLEPDEEAEEEEPEAPSGKQRLQRTVKRFAGYSAHVSQKFNDGPGQSPHAPTR